MRYRNRRPTRAEVNAAMYLYSPLTTTEKEKQMPKANDKQTANDNANQNAIATREPSQIEAIAGTEENLALSNLSSEAIGAALEAFREMEVGFETFTKTETVAALDVPLVITDVITILIRNRNPKPGEGETKPVHVFRLETPDGLEYLTMLGANPWRDRIASNFAAASAVGARPRVGPCFLQKEDVGQIQPAWVFRKAPGFKLDKGLPAMGVGV